MRDLLAGLVVAAVISACAHTADHGGPGTTHVPEDLIEEDAILGSFETPPPKKDKKKKAAREESSKAAEPDGLDRKEETEDPLLSTVEPDSGHEPAGSLVIEETPGGVEVDSKEIREDPLLSEVDDRRPGDEDQDKDKEEADPPPP